MSVFFDRFSKLCDESGTSPNAVAKLNGISSGSVTAWKKGTIPRPETLSRLAEHFCVSVDYLVGKSDERYYSVQHYAAEKGLEDPDENYTILSRNARNMSPENRAKLVELAKMMFDDFKEGSDN